MVVLLALLAVFALLVLLLAIPLEVTFRFEGIEAFNGWLTIRWMFGLARFRITVPRITEPVPQPLPTRKAAKARVKRTKRGARANVVAVLRQSAFRRRTYRFIKDLIRAAHLHRLRLRLRLGLGDPADTGRLWAVVGPLSAAAQSLRNAEVRIEPEFMDPVFEFQADGRMLLVPLKFVGLAVGFALSPPSIRAWRTLIGNHA